MNDVINQHVIEHHVFTIQAERFSDIIYINLHITMEFPTLR